VEHPDAPSVQMLWDIEQIKQLKARYFRLLDTKDWDAFADLFTEDCLHTLPSAEPRPPQSNAEYLAGLRSALGEGMTVHHGHMPEITILGPREASGIWAMFDYLDVDRSDGLPLRMQGYGHYFETYRKCDDGAWRISSKRNVRLRVDTPSPEGTG
jgi:ketosteroid isomerase-like protein